MRGTCWWIAAGLLWVMPAQADEPAEKPTYSTHSAWRGDRVAPPPVWRDEGPPPLARAPEHVRRPVEVVPEATLALSLCEGGAGSERCEALGPAVGAGLLALYRPTQYFAFGGGVNYAQSSGTLAGVGPLASRHVALGVVSRVYLLEEGALDPYLELSFGWSSWRTTLTAPDGSEHEDGAFGPSAQAGGGLDFVPWQSVKVGGAVALRELVFGRGERCGSGRCQAGGLDGGATHGELVAALRVSLQFGDAL